MGETKTKSAFPSSTLQYLYTAPCQGLHNAMTRFTKRIVALSNMLGRREKFVHC